MKYGQKMTDGYYHPESNIFHQPLGPRSDLLFIGVKVNISQILLIAFSNTLTFSKMMKYPKILLKLAVLSVLDVADSQYIISDKTKNKINQS